MTEVIENQNVPIGGWLRLIAIAVWFMGISGILALLVEVLTLEGFMPRFTTPYKTIEITIESAVSVLLWVLFVNRKRVFIKLSIWYLVVNSIYAIVSTAIIPGPKASYYVVFIEVVLYVISAIYLIRSKRVKNTFVR